MQLNIWKLTKQKTILKINSEFLIPRKLMAFKKHLHIFPYFLSADIFLNNKYIKQLTRERERERQRESEREKCGKKDYQEKNSFPQTKLWENYNSFEIYR